PHRASVVGFHPLLRIDARLPGDGRVFHLLCRLSHRLARGCHLPDCFRADVCVRRWAETNRAELASIAQRMDFRSRRPHLHRLRRTIPELWCEPALSGAGAGVEVKTLEFAAWLAASVADH